MYLLYICILVLDLVTSLSVRSLSSLRLSSLFHYLSEIEVQIKRSELFKPAIQKEVLVVYKNKEEADRPMATRCLHTFMSPRAIFNCF